MDDPRAALDDKDLAVRATALRELQRIGTIDDVSRLLQIAGTDKKPSVRLHAVAAAMGVLRRSKLTNAKRVVVHEAMRGVDAATNPSSLGVYAILGDEASLDRLVRLSRHLHGGVRTGVIIALRQWALSHRRIGEPRVEALFRELLTLDRTPDDVRIGVCRLVGEAGIGALEPLLRQRTPSRGEEIVAQALRRLAGRTAMDFAEGFWTSDGRDIFQEDDAGPMRWMAVCGSSTGDADGIRPLEREGLRIVYAIPVGETEETRFLQRPGESWRLVDGKALADEAETHLMSLPPEVAGWMGAWLSGLEGAAGERLRPLLQWRRGDARGAKAAFAPLVEVKKPRADLHYWFARICEDAGDAKAARSHAAVYLDKAGKKAEFRKDAERMRDGA